MGTIECENQIAPPLFQGPLQALQTPQEPWRFTGTPSVSLAEPVPRISTLRKKRKLFLELTMTLAGSFALPPLTIHTNSHISTSLFRNINRIPFRPQGRCTSIKTPTFIMAFTYALGSTDPCPTAVHKEPFSTLVFKALTWIFATTTKIYTDDSSGPALAGHLQRTSSRPFYSLRPIVQSTRPVIAAEYGPEAQAPSIFRASWFGRWVVTHSLAVSNFHGHRPAVYINQHLFWSLMSFQVWRLISAFGSSHSASSAYQKWPTWTSIFYCNELQSRKSNCLPIQSLRIGWGSFRPQFL